MWAAAAPAQTPQKIVEEDLRASGGAKAVGQVRSMTIAGSLTEEATGATGSYSVMTKAPGKFYAEILTGTDRAVEAYNAMSGWTDGGGEGARTLTGAAVKEIEAES